LPTLLDDERDHTFEAIANLGRSDAQRLNALRRQPVISADVPLRVGPKFMREAIDLNAERRFVTKEVESIITERMLPSELETARSESKQVPKTPLWGRHFLAEFARSVGAQLVFLT
jgi:hypothetical protein